MTAQPRLRGARALIKAASWRSWKYGIPELGQVPVRLDRRASEALHGRMKTWAALRVGLVAGVCFAQGCSNSTEPAASSSGEVVAATTPESAILADFRARFHLRVERMARTVDADQATDEAPAPPERLSVGLLAGSASTGTVATAGAFSPTWPAKSRPGATLHMPLFADGKVEIQRASASVSVHLRGAAHAQGAPVDGHVVFRGGFGGRNIVLRPTLEGVEDFVLFESAPPDPSLEYDVDLISGVVGLRLVSGVLEFVDEAGDPRVRVVPPYLVDSVGHAASASLSVSGCAYDANPAAPWGRKPVVPGAATCRVRVQWDNSTVNYPALLDPSWTSTGSLIEGRGDFTATVLDDGRVLVAGGHGPAPTVGAELYNPATGTFAATGAPVTRRDDHVAVKLQNGNVLIAGGEQTGVWSTISSSELYNPVTGTFSTTGVMVSARREFSAERLADGRVIAIGGWNGGSGRYRTSEFYNPASGTWSRGPNMSALRSGLKTSTLTNGKILVTGGYTGSAYLSSTELFDPTSNAFSAGGTMASPRRYHAQAALGYSGQAIVSGGMTGTSTTTTSVEVYNAVSNTFMPAGTLSQERMKHVGVAFTGGTVLFAGGQTHTVTCTNGTDTSDAFSPATSPSTSMAFARSNFAAVPLGNKVLVMGGYDGAVYRTEAEIFDPSTLPTSSVLHDSASPAQATVTWVNPNPKGVFAPSDAYGATITSALDQAQTVQVDVVASGLDSRLVARNIATVALPAYGQAPVSVVLSDVPLRSVGTESTFWLRVRPVDAFGAPSGPQLASSPISVEWDPAYSSVTSHGSEGHDFDRLQPPPSGTGAAWRAATHATFHALATLAGQVWSPTAGFADLSTLPPNDPAKGEYAMRGQWAQDFHDLGPSFVADYVPNGTLGYYKFCMNWRAIFSDGAMGDDFLNTNSTPATYAWATVLADAVTPQVVLTGPLSSQGCTAPVALGSNDSFTFLVMSDLVRPNTGSEVVVSYYKTAAAGPNGAPYSTSVSPLVVAQSWTPSAGSGGPPLNPDVVSFTTKVEDPATRVAAVLGQMLKLDLGIPWNTVMKAYANTGCPNFVDKNGMQVEACGAGTELFVGHVLNNTTNLLLPDQHNSQYKYVVAHEFGHVIASNNLGLAFWHGAPQQPDTPSSQPSCRCDSVVEGNRSHCLQSREYEGFAINEGFAHFIAARTFNDPTQLDCIFAYYKSFVVQSGGVPNYPIPLPPPVPVTCTGIVKWIDNHCPAAPGVHDELGNEWDWMTFFYDETNHAGGFTLQELYQSFRLACTGLDGPPSSITMCNGHNVLFNRQPVIAHGTTPYQPLSGGACVVAGQGTCSLSNTRYQDFVNTGSYRGVDH